MRSPLLASAAVAIPAAFFNTNSGKKLFICATAQQATLDKTAFQGLTWVQIKGVGSVGETGASTNILSYNTWDDAVVRKAKGMTDAGSPVIEVARDPTDAGQVLLRAACLTNFNYAFKIVGNDKPNNDPDSEPTIRYNRGLVTGPKEPNGRNEDFDLEVFSLGLQQLQITVDPIDGTTIP